MNQSKINIDTNMNETGVKEWLKPEKWPSPKWFTEKKLTFKINQEVYFCHQLRTRYVELEGEFRTVSGNFPPSDLPTAAKIFDFLQLTRKALEQTEPDLLTISNTLNIVERYMIWVYPPHLLNARIITILASLESIRPPGWEGYNNQITNLSKNVEDNLAQHEDEIKRKEQDEADETLGNILNEVSGDEKIGDKLAIANIKELTERHNKQQQWKLRIGYLCGVLDEAIGACNKQIVDEQISNGLQIERLRALRGWGIVLLAVFMMGSPLATNLSTLKDWPSQLINQGVLTASLLNALGIAIIGAVGGFLSGLLQARSSKVSLTEYQENMLKLQIKPLIGALFSMVLYVLLSWQILPGISIQNIGTYFFIAFLSGFSERYFLQMLELKVGKEEISKTSEEKIPNKEIAKNVTNVD